MQHTRIHRKPTLAMVIAFCDGTPYREPTPYVIAQRYNDACGLELWNMEIPDDVSNMDVFELFAREHLYEPSDEARYSFLPLARTETEDCHLRIFGGARLFTCLQFKSLHHDKVKPVPLDKLDDYEHLWNDMTRLAIDVAFRSEGMKFILDTALMIGSGRAVSREAHHERRAL